MIARGGDLATTLRRIPPGAGGAFQPTIADTACPEAGDPRELRPFRLWYGSLLGATTRRSGGPPRGWSRPISWFHGAGHLDYSGEFGDGRDGGRVLGRLGGGGPGPPAPRGGRRRSVEAEDPAERWPAARRPLAPGRSVDRVRLGAGSW